MTETQLKKFSSSSQNYRSKSKKDENESYLKDATNKINTSQPVVDNKELSSTQKSGGGFKSFFGGFLKHKPDNVSPLKAKDIEAEMKLIESGYMMRKKDKGPNKSKFINRKNITNGNIVISKLDNTDVVDEKYDIPTKENIYELLDQAPAKISSHLENRKTGRFSWISKRAIKNLMETKAKGQKPMRGDHMEDDLITLINDMSEFYHKLFFFFQGLLSGLCLMHLLIIFFGADTNLTNYSHLSLRLNQVFHIVSLLAVFGSIHRSTHAKTLYNQSLKYQNESLGKDRKSYFKNITSFFCFLIVYSIVIYTNEFASSISKVATTIATQYDQYSSGYNIWKILNVVATIFSLLGWLLVISNSEIERPSNAYEEIDEENEKEEV